MHHEGLTNLEETIQKGKGLIKMVELFSPMHCNSKFLKSIAKIETNILGEKGYVGT